MMLFRSLSFLFFLLPVVVTAGPFHLRSQDGSAEYGGIRAGLVYGRYTHHLSGPEIYMWRVNNGFADGNKRILEVSDKFSDMQHFYGLNVVLEGENDHGICYEFGWTARRRVCDARYKYDHGQGTEIIDHYEKVKMTFGNVFFTAGARPTHNRKLFVGASIDIGILRTKIKTDDPAVGSGGWDNWFYRTKLLGSGFKGSDPVAGYSLHASYDISVFTLRISHMRTILDGELNSQTNKYTNLPWSTKLFPIGNTMLSLMYHL